MKHCQVERQFFKEIKIAFARGEASESSCSDLLVGQFKECYFCA